MGVHFCCILEHAKLFFSTSIECSHEYFSLRLVHEHVHRIESNRIETDRFGSMRFLIAIALVRRLVGPELYVI